MIPRVAGAPDTIRTCDLRFRKPLLYPAELREQGNKLILLDSIASVNQRTAVQVSKKPRTQHFG